MARPSLIRRNEGEDVRLTKQPAPVGRRKPNTDRGYDQATVRDDWRGDKERMRGIPCEGGAIRGTRPEDELLRTQGDWTSERRAA